MQPMKAKSFVSIPMLCHISSTTQLCTGTNICCRFLFTLWSGVRLPLPLLPSLFGFAVRLPSFVHCFRFSLQENEKKKLNEMKRKMHICELEHWIAWSAKILVVNTLQQIPEAIISVVLYVPANVYRDILDGDWRRM